nr:hypothetical protein [Tanacetum cinerariifolium]
MICRLEIKYKVNNLALSVQHPTYHETPPDQLRFIMDDPNITMEEYIRLEEEKAQRHGRTFNWEIATYALSYKPTLSLLNDNQIDFRISLDESDDEDYMMIYDKNSFSYKIIYVDGLETNSKNDNDKVNMSLFSSPEPQVSYFNDLEYFKDFEKEFAAIVYNDALTSKLDLLTKPTDLAVKKSTIWYTLKKTCVELIQAF